MNELLAVYGTLMSGQSYAGRPDVERLMRSLGPCRIPGALYSDGDYPWLVEAEGEVRGELYEVADPAGVFGVLDAYEDDSFVRRMVRLLEPEVDAWVYLWNGAPRGEPLDDGDWRTWLALRGDR